MLIVCGTHGKHNWKIFFKKNKITVPAEKIKEWQMKSFEKKTIKWFVLNSHETINLYAVYFQNDLNKHK